MKYESQERASYDYIHATLVIKGINIVLGSKETFPSIYDAYPNLFNDVIEKQQEALEEKRTTLSVLRFKQFAQSHNNKYKNEEVPKENDE